jgi:hypothetical protein
MEPHARNRLGLRGRIEAVLDMARALGHIDADRANPARRKGHLDYLLRAVIDKARSSPHGRPLIA